MVMPMPWSRITWKKIRHRNSYALVCFKQKRRNDHRYAFLFYQPKLEYRLKHAQLRRFDIYRFALLEIELIKDIAAQFHIDILLIVCTFDFQAHQ